MNLKNNFWKIKKIPIQTLASGDELTLKQYIFTSKNNGPSVYIQSSLHGSEVQGNALILLLMEYLNQNHSKVNGKITFSPLCNPLATNSKTVNYTTGRFNANTGHNWNRNYLDLFKNSNEELLNLKLKFNKNILEVASKNKFKNYLSKKIQERINEGTQENNKINLFHQLEAAQSDIVLDLHTGPIATYYLYTPEYAKKSSSYLQIKNTLIIPNECFGSFDEASFIPWVHLYNAYNIELKFLADQFESYTVELQSEEAFSMENAKNELNKILNYLAYKKVINIDFKKFNPTYCDLNNFITTYAPTGGLIDYLVKPNQKFKKGEMLAQIYSFKNLEPNNPITSTKQNIIANDDGILINNIATSIVNEGMELFQYFKL